MTKPKSAETNKRANHFLFKKSVLEKLRRDKSPGQKTYWDTKQRGFCILHGPGRADSKYATITFRVLYFSKHEPGKPRYTSLGRYPNDILDIDTARKRATKIRGDATEHEAAEETDDENDDERKTIIKYLIEQYIEEFAKPTIKTWRESERCFERYVLPDWGDRNIYDIKKSDVRDLIKKISNKKIIGTNGRKIGTPFVATSVRTQISAFMNWFADEIGNDDFIPPTRIARKTNRRKSTLQRPAPRNRVLEDWEIRLMWPLLDDLGAYGASLKCALLTAQRFHKVTNMKRSNIKTNMRLPGELIGDVWRDEKIIKNIWDPTSPDDPENKKASVVPLSKLTRDIVANVPAIQSEHLCDWVFSGNGHAPINGFSKMKARLDDRMKLKIAQLKADNESAEYYEFREWQHRDLRRTARTIMSRVGVRTKIAEHALGHAMAEIEETYDRYDYLDEKRDAFNRLAKHIERVINPPEADNVVPLKRKK